MSEETTTETTTDSDTEVVAPKPGPKPDNGDDRRDEVTKLRAEAAKHRLEKNKAIEAATAAATARDELTAQLVDAQRSLTVYAEMVRADIPTDLMEDVLALAQGDDPEAIAASVAAAKKLMGVRAKSPAVDPHQGLGNAAPLNSDGLESALKRSLGIA